ncbi:hypothetical protein [Solimonas flava]|uniref:hypothetical protein n=1 Tax=Solimonas flava TaxID=415849 RepID=UPI00042822CD|nr:hypothetical protein [Solimonas flava]
MKKFVKFLGNAAIAGKQVAVYKTESGYQLEAETVGGHAVRYGYRDGEGKMQYRTVPSLTLSDEGYDAFCDRIGHGCASAQDVRITQRALIAMGFPSDAE